MGKAKINTGLMSAITDPEKKDEALRNILLDLDARIYKLEKIGWITFAIVLAIGGKDFALMMLGKL